MIGSMFFVPQGRSVLHVEILPLLGIVFEETAGYRKVEILTIGANYGVKRADFLRLIWGAGGGIVPFLNSIKIIS